MKSLKEIMEDVFLEWKPTQSDREFKGFRGCLERGLVDVNNFSHCGDNKCESCNIVNRIFKEQAAKLNYGE